MKKFTSLFMAIIFSCVVGSTVAFAATHSSYSSAFKKNFKDCDMYTETFSTDHRGEPFNITRKIIGWRNGFCRYEELYERKEDSYKLNCSLSDVQVEELTEAMKNRSKELEKQEIEMFAEVKDPKTGIIKYETVGFTQVKGTKASNAWAKYLNNPYFCRPEKIK